MARRSLDSVANELLVLRCQGGDERALAVLYEHWSPRLARHAARLTGRREAVADVCQDAWLAIARGLGRLDDPARFPAWAYRIVSRRCADWIRARARAAETTTPLVGEPTVWYWMELQKNAITREIKRLELQVTRLVQDR